MKKREQKMKTEEVVLAGNVLDELLRVSLQGCGAGHTIMRCVTTRLQEWGVIDVKLRFERDEPECYDSGARDVYHLMVEGDGFNPDELAKKLEALHRLGFAEITRHES